MPSSLFAGVLAIAGLTAIAAQGCKTTGVGDPCVPEQEYNAQFNQFSADEVNVESKSFQCQTRLCLVNHFRGRVSCKYGQDGTADTNRCVLPGGTRSDDASKVTGPTGPNTTPNEKVSPQCLDRTAEAAVYCSCRCQNADGKTDDGANYCTCPDAFECKQLVSSIGAGDIGLTGAYCVKKDTGYDRATACSTDCDRGTGSCGAAN
ncbi:hypothetical protein BH09MYX1_BH09MYX1_28050 [soil metagenome]